MFFTSNESFPIYKLICSSSVILDKNKYYKIQRSLQWEKTSILNFANGLNLCIHDFVYNIVNKNDKFKKKNSLKFEVKH